MFDQLIGAKIVPVLANGSAAALRSRRWLPQRRKAMHLWHLFNRARCHPAHGPCSRPRPVTRGEWARPARSASRALAPTWRPAPTWCGAHCKAVARQQPSLVDAMLLSRRPKLRATALSSRTASQSSMYVRVKRDKLVRSCSEIVFKERTTDHCARSPSADSFFACGSHRHGLLAQAETARAGPPGLSRAHALITRSCPRCSCSGHGCSLLWINGSS